MQKILTKGPPTWRVGINEGHSNANQSIYLTSIFAIRHQYNHCAVITNATLTKSEALKVAQMAHDGLARAIRPAHTLYDGDTLFAAGTGTQGSMNVNRLGMLAADAVEAAIHNGVASRHAQT